MDKKTNNQFDALDNTSKTHQLRFYNIPIDCPNNFDDDIIELFPRDMYTILQNETESTQKKMLIWLFFIAKAAFNLQDQDLQNKLTFRFIKNDDGSVDLVIDNVLKD